MPYPKLSAILNNCILHAITPELNAEIIKIAAGQPSQDGHFMDGYEQLKTLFAQYYQLAPTSWPDFAAILQSYHPEDQQLIWGPVLRMFMELKMKAFIEYPLSDLEVHTDTQIDPKDGRYKSLSPDQLFRHVSSHLGFNIHYHQAASTNPPFDLSIQIALIHIYHEGDINGAQNGGHWEREPKSSHPQTNDHTDGKQLNRICLLIKNPLSVYAGIELMQCHVRETAKAVKLNAPAVNFTDIDASALQLITYLERVMNLKKDTAQRSLGDITAFTAQFIRDNQQDDRDKEYERFYQNPSLAYGEHVEIVKNMHIPVKDLVVNNPPLSLYKPKVSPAKNDVKPVLPIQIPPALIPETPATLAAKPILAPALETISTPISTKRNSNQELLFNEKCGVLLNKIGEYELRRARSKDKEKFNDAIKAAEKLHRALTDEGNRYFQNPNLEGYTAFQKNCSIYLKEAREILSHHRGWLGILDAIVVAIGVTLGFIKLSTAKHVFFATDSSKKLDEIAESVNRAAPSA